jgi:hypothetical protein
LVISVSLCFTSIAGSGYYNSFFGILPDVYKMKKGGPGPPFFSASEFGAVER